jgi:hypothetical protein
MLPKLTQNDTHLMGGLQLLHPCGVDVSGTDFCWVRRPAWYHFAAKSRRANQGFIHMAQCKRSVVAARDRFVEQLERRRLLAAAIDASGMLHVDGTARSDKIIVSRDKGTALLVNINGVTQTFNTADVTGFVIDARSGDDVVQVLPATNGTPITQPITIRGGAGNDVIFGGPGAEKIFAGDGNDIVSGGDGRDSIYGEEGNDSLRGNGASDLIDGAGGSDTLRGDAGNDNLSGGDNPDRIRGSAGNDLLQGGGGRDLLGGEDGDDACFGGNGVDVVDGGTGTDYLEGDGDYDYVYVADNDGFNMSEAYNGECIDAAAVLNTNTTTFSGSIGGAQLDVNSNKLITNGTTGIWNYTNVTGMIQSGRGGSSWDGSSGIITSQSIAVGGTFHTIGVATAPDASTNKATGLWAGQTITGTDTLVMYTYGGDATLDGKLNVDDYIKIDSGIAGGYTGWSNGDFNYDGKINIDDYTTVIDANIGNQTGVFPTGSIDGGIGGVSAVTSTPIDITGTSKADRIIVYNDDDGKIAASVNGHVAHYSPADVIIHAGDGDDVVSVELAGTLAATLVSVYGGAGNDSIYSGDTPDRIEAGEGDDLVSAGGGRNIVYGGAGNDSITGGNSTDHLDGEDGIDTLIGLRGDNFLSNGEVVDQPT